MNSDIRGERLQVMLSPEELAALIRRDYDKWGPIIKAAGIQAE